MPKLWLYEDEMRFKEIPNMERPEWLAWRHTGIGSSDVAVLVGRSRFKDWPTLLTDKSSPVTPEDDSNSYIKERGNKIEFQVRMFMEKTMKRSFSALNVEHTVFPFMKASLDGASEDRKTILEIKLLTSQKPDSINHEAEGYKKWLAARNGEVPREYLPQIQHQLFVTGAEVCFFVGYKEIRGNQIITEDKLAVIPVYPNREYQTMLLKEVFRFWLEVEFKKYELEYRGELE